MLLLCVLIALLLWAYQSQQRITLDVTAPSSEKFLDGFYRPTGSGRWIEAQSSVWLPGLGGGNLPWHVTLRLSGARPGRFDAPAHVTVRANGAKLAEFDARNQELDYEWEVHSWQLGVKGDLLLEIDSSTFKSPTDQQELGVCIKHVWLTRADGVALPSLRTLVLVLALMGGCTLLLRMSLSVSLRRMPLITRTQFLDPLYNPWAWVLVAVWLTVVVALGLNHLQAAWWLQTLTLGLLLIVILTWLIARIVPAPLTRQQALCVLIVVMMAALVRIPFDLGHGYKTDIQMYLSLVWKTVRYGFCSAYLNVSGVPASDNPPVLLYPFWLLGQLYREFFSPLFGHTRLTESAMLRFMLRLPSFTADLLAGAIIFRLLQRRLSLHFKPALFATAAYLFNPALIIDSSYWGQTAAIHALFMLLSLIAIDGRAYGWAGATLAAAILTKPQAVAIAPLVFVLALREAGWLRFSIAAAAVGILLNVPFIVAGRFGDVVQQYLYTTQYDPFVSNNAHNLWWLVTGGQGWMPDTISVGPITFRTIGLLLFACATVVSLIVACRDRQWLFLASAYQSLAFFMLNTQIHENHLLPIFAPLVIAAASDKSNWWLYAGLTFTAVANMLLHDPSLLTSLGYTLQETVYGTPALGLVRWLNAAVQTLLFVMFTVWLIMPLLAEWRLSLARIRR